MKGKKIIIYILTAICFFLAGNQNVFADTVTKRLAGQDRYETAVAISQDGWTKSENLVLASGENFPDALCATPLARAYDAPILLTNKNAATNGVWNEIKRMGVKNVFLIGGTGVIGEALEKELIAKGMVVTRFGGKDRYETAVKVAQGIEKTGAIDKVALVEGNDYASAVGIASIAGKNRMPILLSSKDSIESVVAQYLKGKSIAKSYIVGGTELLSANIEKGVVSPIRLQGKDKYEVNLRILNEFADEYKYEELYITTGENYPDALAASASAVKTSAPVLLVNKALLTGIEEFINKKNLSTKQIKLIGGEAVLPSTVTQNIIKKEEPPKPIDPPKDPDPVVDPSKKALVICLDAGDGTGIKENVGPNGLKERDVNLAVALKAGKILEEKGMTVVYTRKADSMPWDSAVDLLSRFKVADDGKADFFISIHCNAFDNPETKGAETYYLEGVSAGQNMATVIQNKLMETMGSSVVNRGIKAGSQPELKGTSGIGVKVYLGFITNPDEEKNLGSEELQSKYAEAIAQGILNYKDINKPVVGKRSVIPEDVMITVNEGESYTLPETVNIIQKDGTRTKSAVTWGSNTADTSKPGIYVIEGIATETSSKVYLAVTVLAKNDNNGYLVTLDPGHGGYDTGAIGANGIREKDVTLAVGLKVADILAKNGVKLVYTRVSDNVTWPSVELLDLQARCEISNAAKPNLYLAIHINSFSNPAASGIETYYSEGNSRGSALAVATQKELLAATGLVDRRVKTANHYVTTHTDTLATLVELGFVSNANEEQLLGSDEFQNKCAVALAKAIMDTLQK